MAHSTSLFMAPAVLIMTAASHGQQAPAANAEGAPVIEEITYTHAPTPSSRVIITGSGFGERPGDSTVYIGGRKAIVTQRLGDEIHAYVPEGIAAGDAKVQVVTESGQSNTEHMYVSPRVGTDDRVRWRFQTDRWMIPQNIGVGPDGNVYTSDNLGLYALSPDGALLWFVPDAGGGYPIDIGPDGTIYAGPTLNLGLGPEHRSRIFAINPDGSIKWTYEAPQPVGDSTLPLENGPSVGPDGNIYALQDKIDAGDVGLGMFSLDPSGNLIWNNIGDPYFINIAAGDNMSEIVFADDRLYTGFVAIRSPRCCPVTYAFDLDGDQLWFSDAGGLGVRLFGYPRVGLGGRAIAQFSIIGLQALEPDGSTAWSVTGPARTNIIMPDVDAAGNVYTAEQFGGELWSVDPAGNTRFYADDGPTGIFYSIGVTPNGSEVVVGGSVTYGQPGFIRGYSGADGGLLWELPLEDENGARQHVRNRYASFSPDGRTAYHTTSFNEIALADYGYLYALRLEGGSCRVDLDGDGSLTIFDFLAFQTAFDAGDPVADFDGDGDLTIFDFLAFQTEFDAGCE